MGGVDIESVAKDSPEKIVTNKVDLNKSISNEDIENIIKVFSFDEIQKKYAKNLVNALYQILLKKTHLL